MKTSNFNMKRQSLNYFLLLSIFISFVFNSCRKSSNYEDSPSDFSSEVLDKWMTLQIRLMRNTTGVPNHGFSRYFGYSGVAAMESLKPVIHYNKKWTVQWNELSNLPTPTPGIKYYYPANVNAALATMNRFFFPNANALDKMAIDSLEAALNQEFLSKKTDSVISSSANFGKAVALAVYNWAETDGYKHANDPYTPPTGPGKWVPTTPGTSMTTPFWGNNRTIIKGSISNTVPAAPPAYSEDPASPFYLMVKEVYDVSQKLTDEQKAMASYWRDVPGITSPGHWVSIVQQVLKQKKVRLDKAVMAYALTGAAVNDALITCLKSKLDYSLVRPVTYIRNVMGFSSWNAFLGTPGTAEYTSAHAALSVAASGVLTELFGKKGSFTDHTYDYLGYAPRVYSSLAAIGEEAGQSRLYAGIHYQLSIDAGSAQGKKVVENIFGKQQVK